MIYVPRDLTDVRIRSGQVFVRCDLAGHIEQRRVPAARPRRGSTGSTSRWIARPATWAWTLGTPAAPYPFEQVHDLDPCVTREAAVFALLDHLVNHRAPVVIPLYLVREPLVSAAEARSRAGWAGWLAGDRFPRELAWRL